MSIASLEDKYLFIDQQAQSFLESIIAARDSAKNEREFQTKVTFHIEQFAKSVGVALLLREEYTLVTGRADAVYNRLIIEYERPGSLRANLNHGHTRHAVNQVKQYIEEVAKTEKHDRDRLLGVAFDGEIMVFARYRDGHWYVESPLEVNKHSAARLLRSLVSLSSGRALIPENLVEDFGAQNIYSQRVARALYHAMEGHTDDLTATLFRQWQLFFGQVSGYEEATARLQSKKQLRQFARGMGLRPEDSDPPRLFFVIHTYFSFLVKAIARLVLERYAGASLGPTPLAVMANLEGEKLRRELEKLEDGGIFRTLGLNNLLEGDFFAWYLQAWTPEVQDSLRLTLNRLAEYNPSTIEDDPFAARDLLKKLYHYLLPRELRHDLGEFYTPDWLAERVLTQLNEPLFVFPKETRQSASLFPSRRLLDPACGSGTFLVLAIRAIKEHATRQGISEADTLEYILEGVVGFDLNPLAVMAARVNYLLAIADLIPFWKGPIDLPVYLADSILAPSEGSTLFEQGKRTLNTVVGALPMPEGINSASRISKLTDLLDEFVSSQFSTNAFMERACAELNISKSGTDEGTLRGLYEKLLDLESKGLDGVWARVLKNAFMPLFVGRFDYIVGNPPWVNWESLPDGYRNSTTPLWSSYGLFAHKGFKAILGGSKDDISILMTYVACDRYLEEGGKLAFLITQTVFKTAEGGRGFRRFQLGDEQQLRVLHVDDMSTLNPFEGATNRTSVIVLQKGERTRYPVPYTYWRKTTSGRGLDYDSTFEEVVSLTRRAHFQAVPVDVQDPTSAWLTARPRALRAMSRYIGKSPYKARKGVYASANGVFWLEHLGDLSGEQVIVRNMAETGKLPLESMTVDVEADLVHPLLRGRDVKRWTSDPSIHILLTHFPSSGLRAIPIASMEKDYPRALAYLNQFKETLSRTGLIRRYFTRKDKRGKQIATGPFYSMFNIGEYSFSPYKVVLREISTSLIAAVSEPQNGQPVIPDHKLVIVPFSREDEAHYVCALLNSSPANLLLLSYAVTTQISTHIFRHLAIPRFERDNSLHQELAQLSMEAHIATSQGEFQTLTQLDWELDWLSARLWGCSTREMVEIHSSIREYGGTPPQHQEFAKDA